MFDRIDEEFSKDLKGASAMGTAFPTALLNVHDPKLPLFIS